MQVVEVKVVSKRWSKFLGTPEILERVVNDEKIERGEGGSGGVALCNTIEKVEQAAKDMLVGHFGNEANRNERHDC